MPSFSATNNMELHPCAFGFDSDTKDVKKVELLEDNDDVKNINSEGKQKCLVCNQYFSHFELEMHYLECLLDEPNQSDPSQTNTNQTVHQLTSDLSQPLQPMTISSPSPQPSTSGLQPLPMWQAWWQMIIKMF